MSDPEGCPKQRATNKPHTKAVWIIRAMISAGEMLPIAQATGQRLALPWVNGRLLLVLARTARQIMTTREFRLLVSLAEERPRHAFFRHEVTLTLPEHYDGNSGFKL